MKKAILNPVLACLAICALWPRNGSGETAAPSASSSDSVFFGSVGGKAIYADLRKGDSWKTVFDKLKRGEFREIEEVKGKGILRCAAKLKGFRYDLVCRFENDRLKLCVLEGRKGWQFSFYDEILEPQWANLRQQLIKAYGSKRDNRALPKIGDIPLNDPGGVITDTWELEDRLVVIAVQAFELKDCCTNRLIEYSTCLVLIQPK
ncbi:MAG: hypothetical protein VCA36_12495 [Opitutales bacterium]